MSPNKLLLRGAGGPENQWGAGMASSLMSAYGSKLQLQLSV